LSQPTGPLVIDTGAARITAHSDKEQAAPTFKRGFGFHRLWAFVDHGAEGTGEPLTCLLRKGNAGSKHCRRPRRGRQGRARAVPRHKPGTRPGGKILIRADGAGATQEFLNWLVSPRLSYSVEFSRPDRRWRGYRATVGRQPTTVTASSARVRGSPTSPACWISSPGLRGCG